MGIDVNQIVSDLGKTHVHCACSICTCLLEDAVTLGECEHNFCRGCLNQWVRGQTDPLNVPCPACETIFSPDDIKPIKPLMKAILSDIKLKCPFEDCGATVGYEEYTSHVYVTCTLNPLGRFQCTFCDSEIMQVEMETHNGECVKRMQYQMSELKIELAKVKSQLHLQDILWVEECRIPKLHETRLMTTFVVKLKCASKPNCNDKGIDKAKGYSWYRTDSAEAEVLGGKMHVVHQNRRVSLQKY